MNGTLRGRRALVTGGVRRLGRAFALALADAGADVVVTSRSLDTAAGSVLEELRAFGVRAQALLCDVRSPDSVTAAVAQAVEFLGGLDLLINNAGTFESTRLEALSPEQWDEAYAVNARGPFLVAQAALPFLRVSGQGRVINIGSLGGSKPWATHGHYCASKAALHMLSQTMAKAWAPEVSVNCVAPGMIRFPDEPERMAGKTPMGRDGSPEDVVSAVMYFATSPGFVTGQVMAVDGGLSLI